MLKNANIFENTPVPKAVAILALPTVLSMLVNVVYNMVDTFFVSKTGDPNQVAAVSIATPVFLLLMAAGNIFGIGGSAFVSRSLGRKEYTLVKKISSFCFYTSIGVGIIMGIIFLLEMPLILKLCGASDNTAGYTKEYLVYIAYGAPFVVVSCAFSNIVRGEGAAKASMIGMMLGTIVNIILDPIMILSMNMGVAGAAIATIIGNICSFVYYLWYLLKKDNSLLSISPKDFDFRNGIFKNVFAIGTPASLNNILMSLSNIIMNNFLARYGDIPVAAMGIATKANILVVFIQLGLGMGIQPLIGYNYGAKNFKRMKAVMKFSMVCNLISSTVLTIIYLIYAEAIIGCFIDNQEIVEYGAPMLRRLMISMPILGLLFIFGFAFQAMGKALPSLILSISRQGFVFLPMLFIGRAIAGLNGIVLAQPVADIFSVVLALVMFLAINKNLKKQFTAGTEPAVTTEGNG